MTTQALSFEEIARMKQIIAEHEGMHQPVQTIDLNNPPKAPYRFQKFPMMVYAENSTLIVRSEAELEEALSDGWLKTPVSFSEKREEYLSAAYQAEAARVQEQIEETKRKPGRPRNNPEAA